METQNELHAHTSGTTDSNTQTGTPPARRHVKAPPLIVICLFVALPVVILDQVSKQLILSKFQAHTPYPLLGEYLSIEVVRNPGAAFSFLSGHTWVFTLIAVFVLGWIIWIGRITTNRYWQILLGVIAGGSAGNLIDRLVRPPAIGSGHVIDFINYAGFFVGNVADIFIVVGVCCVVLLVFLGVPTRTPAAPSEEEKTDPATGTDLCDEDKPHAQGEGTTQPDKG